MRSSYSSSIDGSSLDGESLIFSCSHLLFSSDESRFFFFSKFAEINHFLLAHILRMNKSHDPERPFKVAITTSILQFFFYRFKMFCILDLHILQLFSQSHLSDLSSYLQISWSRNQTYLVSLGRHLWYKLIHD